MFVSSPHWLGNEYVVDWKWKLNWTQTFGIATQMYTGTSECHNTLGTLQCNDNGDRVLKTFYYWHVYMTSLGQKCKMLCTSKFKCFMNLCLAIYFSCPFCKRAGRQGPSRARPRKPHVWLQRNLLLSSKYCQTCQPYHWVEMTVATLPHLFLSKSGG